MQGCRGGVVFEEAGGGVKAVVVYGGAEGRGAGGPVCREACGVAEPGCERGVGLESVVRAVFP